MAWRTTTGFGDDAVKWFRRAANLAATLIAIAAIPIFAAVLISALY
jgi:hypothetical protein